MRTSQMFAVKKLVSRTQLGHLWFKVSGRLFRLLHMDEVVRMTDKSSGLDWRHYPVTTTMQDAFVMMVRYDGGGPLLRPCLYHWPRTDWPVLYKDAKNNDEHVVDKPLCHKLSDRPLMLTTNDLLDLKRVELHSVNMGLRLWPKVAFDDERFRDGSRLRSQCVDGTSASRFSQFQSLVVGTVVARRRHASSGRKTRRVDRLVCFASLPSLRRQQHLVSHDSV